MHWDFEYTPYQTLLALGLDYYFLFDHNLMKHPKWIKNQVQLEIRSSCRSIPFMVCGVCCRYYDPMCPSAHKFCTYRLPSRSPSFCWKYAIVLAKHKFFGYMLATHAKHFPRTVGTRAYETVRYNRKYTSRMGLPSLEVDNYRWNLCCPSITISHAIAPSHAFNRNVSPQPGMFYVLERLLDLLDTLRPALQPSLLAHT